uniref:Elongation factor Ts, mitochondrial n=1 Tax=Eptatretus burgeri TaxID=7764 RepID=A0A8C4R2Q9_EPTBU
MPALCASVSAKGNASHVKKDSLRELRRRTGYSFSSCKEALVKFDDDLQQAEVWLEEQARKRGWDKTTQLQTRVANQGLIGFLQTGSTGVGKISTGFCPISQETALATLMLCTEFGPNGWMDTFMICYKNQLEATSMIPKLYTPQRSMVVVHYSPSTYRCAEQRSSPASHEYTPSSVKVTVTMISLQNRPSTLTWYRGSSGRNLCLFVEPVHLGGGPRELALQNNTVSFNADLVSHTFYNMNRRLCWSQPSKHGWKLLEETHIVILTFHFYC